MKYLPFILSFFCGLLSSCKSNNQTMNAKLDSIEVVTNLSKKDTLDNKLDIGIDTMDCGELVNLLFQRSSYKFYADSSFIKEQLTASINEVQDSVLIIKISQENKTKDDEIIVDWLNLDLKSKKLEQMGPDLNKPIQVSYDNKILERLLKKCDVSDY